VRNLTRNGDAEDGVIQSGRCNDSRNKYR